MKEIAYGQMVEIMNIVNQFDIEQGSIDMVESFGEGRINRTFKITVRRGKQRFEYLLQNINEVVFGDTKGLMENITSVTDFIRRNGGISLQYIMCKDGLDESNTNGPYIYIDDKRKKHWRMYHFIDADVYQGITDPKQAFLLGKAIADFSVSLDTFDATKLKETIPDFHNTPKRYESLLVAIANDAINHTNRVAGVEEEIEFILARKSKLGILMESLEKGDIPYRVVHNDPKLNNVLFDKENHVPICMIDLDTIMPGTGLFDVGDAIRYIANTASEEEKTTENVSLSLEIYNEFVNGYLDGMGDGLTEKEKELIPISAWVLTMELGIRFLTDHINGNKYFNTEYDGQNVERARIQFALAKDIENKILK